MKQRTPGAERLYRARKQASRELKLPVDSWQVRRFALLMCAHDNVTARLANGADVSIDNLLKIDSAMQEIRSSVPQEALKVQIEIVNPEPLPEPTPPSPPSGGGGPAPADSAPVAALPANVVPLHRPEPSLEDIRAGKLLPNGEPHPNTLPRRAVGGIHDGRLPNGQPARMVGPSYAYYGGGGYAMPTVAGPFSAVGEKPNFDAKHSLPDAAYDAVRYPRYKGLCW